MTFQDGIEKIYKVSELLAEARALLEASFPWVAVEGEVTNSMRSSAGHWYFTLKDERGALDCVCFRNVVQGLPFQIEEGTVLLARGVLTLYEPRGRFQLKVQALVPAGFGALQLAFEQLKKRLAAEGIFDPERKKKLPRFPARIAVVTSPQGAAIHDFLKVLSTRAAVQEVRLFPADVQGEGAIRQIPQALREADAWGGDLLVLIRGGGSLEDLAAFNHEAVVRALASCRTPTLCGVGHEVDVTLCDFAADERAATPTDAAVRAAPARQEVENHLNGMTDRLREAMEMLFVDAAERIAECRKILASFPPQRVFDETAQRLDEAESGLKRAIRVFLDGRRKALEFALRRFFQYSPLWRLQLQREKNEGLLVRLKAAARRWGKPEHERLGVLAHRLELAHPEAPLRRGYALVFQSASGKLLRRAPETRPGEGLHIRLGEGDLKAEVTKVFAKRQKKSPDIPSVP